MKTGGWVVIAIVAIGGLYLLKTMLIDPYRMKHQEVNQTQTITSVILPDAPRTESGANVQQEALPDPNTLTAVGARPLVMDVMAWNAQMGLMFANGGPTTTKGSLVEKNNVMLTIKRQDDCNIMGQELIKFAKDYKDDPSKASGTNFMVVMGDGAPAILAGINPELEKLGPEYKAKIIFAMGKSLGEDKLMGPQAWKDNPQKAKGGVVAAVIRDGDWNIAVKWASDNNIPINPDETTYDPEALNFTNADDFLKSANKYIMGEKEDRAIVGMVNGKQARTGQTKSVTPDAVATWTPGDVNIAEKKGGLVSIVSTAEYRSQMPAVIIGIDKFMSDNRKEVEGMLMAIAAGGDQVKTFGAALNFAGTVSSTVYGEKDKDGAYWTKYYQGAQQADKQGLVVSLGGSRANNLSDNFELFGLNNGGNVYASVYKVFGDIDVKLYPKLVPSYPAIGEVLDLTYLGNLKSSSGNVANADKVSFTPNEAVQQRVSQKPYSIEFATGSASFTPAATKVLEDLYNQLVIASSLKLEIHGHTDNVGSPDANRSLSQARAEAVKKWLIHKSAGNFPESRFGAVMGHGQDQPIASNETADGKAKNRRVEIIMGK